MQFSFHIKTDITRSMSHNLLSCASLVPCVHFYGEEMLTFNVQLFKTFCIMALLTSVQSHKSSLGDLWMGLWISSARVHFSGHKIHKLILRLHFYLFFEEVHSIEQAELDESQRDGDLSINACVRSHVIKPLSQMHILKQSSQYNHLGNSWIGLFGLYIILHNYF